MLINQITKDEQEAYNNFVHNPTQAYQEFCELGRKLHNSRGIETGSKNLDKVMIPTRGPWVRVWLAAQSQGKSTMLRIIAFNEANRLVMEDLDDKFYVAHITYEEAVDAQELYYQRNRKYTNEQFWRGDVEPSEIVKGGLTRADLPIYWLGESMSRSNINSPPMTIDMCMAGLRAIYKIENKLPSCIILDYVQEVEVGPYIGNERTLRVIEAMRQIMRMGTITGCAIELGAQARRTSLKNKPPLPEPDDLEWAHYVSQKATNIVGLWRPWTTHRNHGNAIQQGITINKVVYPFDEYLTVAKTLKHRPGKQGATIPMKVDPDTLTVTDFKNVNMNYS